MIDWTKPIKQRCGRKAVFLSTGINMGDIVFVVAIELNVDMGIWTVRQYEESGAWRTVESHEDIIQSFDSIPKTITREQVEGLQRYGLTGDEDPDFMIDKKDEGEYVAHDALMALFDSEG